MAMRAARLHLNVERPDFQSPLALLLGETEAAAATCAEDVYFTNPYGVDCNASARAPTPPPAAISGEFVFGLSLINCLYRPRDDGFARPDYAAGPAHKHVFYTHSDVVPTFLLPEEACRVLRDPGGDMSRRMSEARPILQAEGSEALVYACLSVTKATTGKTTCLWRGNCFNEDQDDANVTHLMSPHHIGEHDELTHGGYVAGITEYYLRLDCNVSFDEDDVDEAVDEETTPKVALTMWSQVHYGGPYGCECGDHKEHGHGDLSDSLVCLLRNIDFGSGAD